MYGRTLFDEQLTALDVLGQHDLPLTTSSEWRHVMHALSAKDKASYDADAAHPGRAQIVAYSTPQLLLESAPPAPIVPSTDQPIMPIATGLVQSADKPPTHPQPCITTTATASDGNAAAQAADDGAATSSEATRAAEALLVLPEATWNVKSQSKRHVTFADQQLQPQSKRMSTRSSAK